MARPTDIEIPQSIQQHFPLNVRFINSFIDTFECVRASIAHTLRLHFSSLHNALRFLVSSWPFWVIKMTLSNLLILHSLCHWLINWSSDNQRNTYSKASSHYHMNLTSFHWSGASLSHLIGSASTNFFNETIEPYQNVFVSFISCIILILFFVIKYAKRHDLCFLTASTMFRRNNWTFFRWSRSWTFFTKRWKVLNFFDEAIEGYERLWRNNLKIMKFFDETQLKVIIKNCRSFVHCTMCNSVCSENHFHIWGNDRLWSDKSLMHLKINEWY